MLHAHRCARSGVRRPSNESRDSPVESLEPLMVQNECEAYYNDPKVVGHYKSYGRLEPVEAALLARVKEELQDQPILDIGIGGGRITPYLLQVSKAYTGIDFSEGMIQAARHRFHGVDLRICDARDLSRFQNGQFAGVFFFGAGIDDINWADRLLVLKEINRVLTGHGIFILAGHNLEGHWLAGLEGFRLCSNPRIFVADNFLRLRSFISRCRGMLWNVIHDEGYAVFMDYDDCFAERPKIGVVLRTYYMRRSAQIRQLIENGFHEVEALDLDGNTVNDDKAAKNLFLHYVARKQ